MRLKEYGALLLTIAFAGRAQNLDLKNVRVIDGTGRVAMQHTDISVREGRIASVTPSSSKAQVTQTVLPGLINAHGHLGLVKDAEVSPSNYTGVNVMNELVQYERYGITTVLSLGLNKDLIYKMRAEQGKGNEPGATVLTAGRGIGVPNGMPPVKVGSDQVYRPKTAEQARAAVREMAAHSPDVIKIWVDDNGGKLPKMDPAIYTAVIDEAHRANLKVAAHVFYLEDAKKLVQGGVDILAHSIRDKPIDADTLSLLKSHNVFYIPTLQLEESFYIYGEHPAWMQTPFFRDSVAPKQMKLLEKEGESGTEAHRKAFAIAMENLRKVHTATVPVGMGTDSGANPYRIPGWAEHRELQLLVEAGLTPLEAIHAATQVNAHQLGIEDKTGTIEKGKEADLLILSADPTSEIANTQKISAVYRHGQKFRP